MEVKLNRKRKLLAIIPIVLLIAIISQMVNLNETFAAKPPAVPIFLDPKTIPKYVDQLVVPPVYVPDGGIGSTYTVSMVTSRQKILPTGTVLPIVGPWDGMTNVWGYQGNAIVRGNTLMQFDPLYVNGASLPNFVFSPSATFEAVKGTPITVNWVNNINVPQPFAVDPTLKWANPWSSLYGNLPPAFLEGDILSTTGSFPIFDSTIALYGYDGTVRAGNPYGLNAQSPVALVPHLHGAEVQSTSDGGPEAWWTSAATNLKGPHYSTLGTPPLGTAVFYYPNAQEPNTLWYHDHALGITRINVMSGLAGFYLLRDPVALPYIPPTTLTAGNLDEYLTQTFKYGFSEIPIAIQDRTFKASGELWFPEAGLNPAIHPYWMPEFFGNTIMVNGRVWPNLDLTPGWYRFRLLDGSNARFYTLSFDNKMPFTVIGADGGYLQSPVIVNSITIAPGERADILVQFTNAMVGKNIILTNTAKAPFPNGAAADPQTTGQIMQFTVWPVADTVNPEAFGVSTIAALPTTGLNPTLPIPLPPAAPFPTIPAADVTVRRFITLNEVMGLAGPVMVMINGQYYAAGATETPKAGATEEWVIINLTADTHPIHLHLVTFQLVSRQPFQAAKYNTAWLKLQLDTFTNKLVMPPFPKYYTPKILDPALNYYQGKAIAPTPTEMTWKDTLQMNPGEVTTIRVKFASQNGAPFLPTFNPTVGPGYVWHCHIIDHEDNEMMRPLIITP